MAVTHGIHAGRTLHSYRYTTISYFQTKKTRRNKNQEENKQTNFLRCHYKVPLLLLQLKLHCLAFHLSQVLYRAPFHIEAPPSSILYWSSSSILYWSSPLRITHCVQATTPCEAHNAHSNTFHNGSFLLELKSLSPRIIFKNERLKIRYGYTLCPT